MEVKLQAAKIWKAVFNEFIQYKNPNRVYYYYEG